MLRSKAPSKNGRRELVRFKGQSKEKDDFNPIERPSSIDQEDTSKTDSEKISNREMDAKKSLKNCSVKLERLKSSQIIKPCKILIPKLQFESSKEPEGSFYEEEETTSDLSTSILEERPPEDGCIRNPEDETPAKSPNHRRVCAVTSFYEFPTFVENEQDETDCNSDETRISGGSEDEADITDISTNFEEGEESREEDFALEPSRPPPSRESVEDSCDRYGFPEVRNSGAFCSRQADAPDRGKTIGLCLKVTFYVTDEELSCFRYRAGYGQGQTSLEKGRPRIFSRSFNKGRYRNRKVG